MTESKLRRILEEHEKWLANVPTGKRADLHCADLRGANLSNANLRAADLTGADLRDANLSGADLRGVNLHNADLSNATLRAADLRDAALSNANLLETNLCDANLYNASLFNANLRDANLSGAGLDFSCLPLWCASLKAHFDDTQLKQIAYHLVKAGLQSKNASEETKRELAKLAAFANGFHRVAECGMIEVKE